VDAVPCINMATVSYFEAQFVDFWRILINHVAL